MSTIVLDYSPLDQSAVLVAEADCPASAWAEVRRVCEERGQDVINRSPTVLSLPWWSILVFRQDLGYILNKVQRQYGIQWTVTPAANALLQLAKEREKSYRDERATQSRLTEKEVEEQLIRGGFIRSLKPYQLRNVTRLVALPSAADFSVPGSGKTTEALAVFMLQRKQNSRLIIVAPKNAFAVWEEQLSECIPSGKLRIARLQGGFSGVKEALDQHPDIGIISYQQLARVANSISSYIAQNQCSLFLDESHRMKAGRDGVSGSCLLAMSHMPSYKLILTGTPVPNSVNDLIAQFTFLYPEIQTNEHTVIDQFRRVYVRTRKSELGLTAPTRIRHEVELTPAQGKLYAALTQDAARHLAGLQANDRIRFRAFARCVMHLIQAASDPALLASTDLRDHPLLLEALADPSPKITEACRIARELANSGHKCVIWSFFVQTVEHLAGLLKDLGAEYIHGGVDTTPDESVTDSRESKLRRFHDDPKCMVLVANPAACSESISLHRICHHAIYVDRTYNAGQYLQSEDRIHRLGLDKDEKTYIMLIVAPNTIDDSVERRLNAKVALMSKVLNDHDLDIEPIDLTDESDGLSVDDLVDLRKMLLGA